MRCNLDIPIPAGITQDQMEHKTILCDGASPVVAVVAASHEHVFSQRILVWLTRRSVDWVM